MFIFLPKSLIKMKLFMFISFIILYCNSCFTEKEDDFISALSDTIMVTHMVIINQTCKISNKIPQVKYYSLKNIHIVYTNLSEAIKHLKSPDVFQHKMIITLKVETSKDLQNLFKQFDDKFANMRILATYKWLLLLPRNNESLLTQKYFYVPIDCIYFLAQETGNGFEIFEIYHIKKGTNMIYTKFGIWDKKYGLKVTAKYFYEERKNMQGITLILSTEIGVPFPYSLRRINFLVIHEIANVFNFTISYVNVSDAERIKPDIKARDTIFNHFNPNLDHLVAPLMTGKWHFYIQHELDDSQGWSSYLRSFNQDLWLIIALWLIIDSFICVITGRIATVIEAEKDYTLIDQGFTPLTIFCSQGVDHGPNIVSLRIARIFTILVSLVIMSAYSAFIVSWLTFQIPKIPFHNFETFVEDGTYNLSAVYHPVVNQFFQTSKDPAVVAIREKYLESYEEFCELNEICVEILCKKKELSIIGFNYKLTQYPTSCLIFRIPDTVYNFHTAIELGEDVSYRRMFTERITQLRSTGMIQRYNKIMYGDMENHLPEEEFKAIDMNVTKFTIVVLSTGFFLSGFVLLCETLWYNYKGHRKMHTKISKQRHITKKFAMGGRSRFSPNVTAIKSANLTV